MGADLRKPWILLATEGGVNRVGEKIARGGQAAGFAYEFQAKKTRPVSRVKSTPKEEGGGDNLESVALLLVCFRLERFPLCRKKMCGARNIVRRTIL
jgi:hypothetical protein